MLLLLAVPSFAEPQITGQLSMHSEPGDYIGQGRDYLYDSSNGVFGSMVYDRTGDGVPDYMTLSVRTPDWSHWWYLTFGTNQLGVNFSPGVYENAERAAFASAGHPGLDVFGDGRGSNQLTGSFTITEVEFDTTGSAPRLVRFAASFTQYCEGWMPPLTGTINYIDHTDYTTPTTTASFSGPGGSNGWYRGPVEVTLSATDPKGPEDVAATYYGVDVSGGSLILYSSPFVISGEGPHTLTFWSEDQSGNREASQSRSVAIDGTAPTVTASTTMQLVRGSLALVTVSGRITDAVSGVAAGSARYSVVDEYGLVQPTGQVVLQADGSYAFTLSLEEPRTGSDKDGRRYDITVQAPDQAGNPGSQTVTVFVPRH
jgi:hypothetical protein